jgi:hypothetical protein
LADPPRKNNLQVEAYQGELLADIPPSFGPTIQKLGDMIQEEARDISKRIHTLIFSEMDIISFLEETRRPLNITEKDFLTPQ